MKIGLWMKWTHFKREALNLRTLKILIERISIFFKNVQSNEILVLLNVATSTNWIEFLHIHICIPILRPMRIILTLTLMVGCRPIRIHKCTLNTINNNPLPGQRILPLQYCYSFSTLYLLLQTLGTCTKYLYLYRYLHLWRYLKKTHRDRESENFNCPAALFSKFWFKRFDSFILAFTILIPGTSSSACV